MSNPGVFRASYADWKLIKTRSVIQVVLEVPIEQADLAYQVLGGMPSPGAEQWVGIARLKQESDAIPAGAVMAIESGATDRRDGQEDQPVKPRKPVAADKRLAQQAGICCSDPVFRAWARETYPEFMCRWSHGCDEQNVTLLVRGLCGVETRADITPGTNAASRWDDIYSRFVAWKLVAA